MVSKFTDKDLEKIEGQIELKIYKFFQSQNIQLGLPVLSSQQERQLILGNLRCSPLIWEFFEQAEPTAKQRLFTQAVFVTILSDSEIVKYELVHNNLAPFFSKSRDGQLAYSTFKRNQELSVKAMKNFLNHFAHTDYRGSSSADYETWFASLRASLYSSYEIVLNGTSSLNYPDVQSNPSPRLEALRAYLEVIYEIRVKVQLLDLLIRNQPKTGDNKDKKIFEKEDAEPKKTEEPQTKILAILTYWERTYVGYNQQGFLSAVSKLTSLLKSEINSSDKNKRTRKFFKKASNFEY